MIKKKPSLHFLLFFVRSRREFNTCPLPLEPPTPSVSSTTSDHGALCLSLVDQLICRGLFSPAQLVIQRIIRQCPSASDAISVVDFAAVRGMELDPCSYGALIRKLVNSGEYEMAKFLYNDSIISRGINPDSTALASMVICCCKLGEFEEAKTHFDRLISVESVSYKGVCNVLLEELCAHDRVFEAFQYFIGINDAGILLAFRCYSILVDGLCLRGYLDEALHVFDIMRGRRLRCSVHLYKTLVLSLCKREWVEEAELLSMEMESQGLFLDKIMYTTIINGYCKSKKLKMAMRVFLKMLKTRCEPDSYTYNTLIHGFVNLGLPDKGWVLYNHMVESGIKPDAVTHHIMIRKYCKEQKADCALVLLDNMHYSSIAPTVHCYTDLIAALYKEKRLAEVDDLYYRMLDGGIVPDHVLFFTLMKIYPKGHELNLALMLLQAVSKIGCGLDPSSLPAPDSPRDVELEIEHLLGQIVGSNSSLAVVAFSIYILALCASGKTEVALMCIDKMVSLGCQPLLSTYNSLIKCLFQDGLAEDAKSLYSLMQDRGVVPNLATYLIMVNEHCKRGDLASAFDILDEMDGQGLKPSVAIYDSIIGCLSRQKRIFEAHDIFKQMLEAGVDPDEVILVTMINAYSKNGRAILAHQLFDKMVESGIQPSSRAYTALINGLVKKNMIAKGCLYLDRMLEDGFVPNNVLYTSLINQFLRKGELEFAFRLVGLMENCQIEHDLITYITLVSGVCRNIAFFVGRWRAVLKNAEREREALFQLLHQKSSAQRESNLRISIKSLEEINFVASKLMNNIKGTRFMPNLYLYNAMIFGLCWANRMEDAYDHVELMQRDGMCPNQVTFAILIDGHIRFGEMDCAIVLFNTMNANGCTPDRNVYNTLMKGLCKAGRLLDALSLSHTMYKRGYSPCTHSYENLLSGLCANRSTVHALRICEDMLAHDIVPRRHNLNSLLCLLCEEDKLHEAQVVHDMILTKKSKLDDVMFKKENYFWNWQRPFLLNHAQCRH